MLRKALFVALFVPAHAVLTLVMVQRLFNVHPSGLWSKAVSAVGVALMFPILYPCVRADPDGEWFPRWFQMASVPLNSLVWAAAVLVVYGAIKRLRRRRVEAPGPALGARGSD